MKNAVRIAIILLLLGTLASVLILRSVSNAVGCHTTTPELLVHALSQPDSVQDAANLGGNVLAENKLQSTSVSTRRQSNGRKSLGKRKNVLFIIVDDLRPQLGAYYDPEHPDYFSKVKIHTPNLDRLASQSAVFKHAYAQYSLCGPSRTSLLTSRRPDVTRVYNNTVYWRNVSGNFTTLPQYFKNNGYTTVGMGKVFHPGRSSNNNDPISWTEPYYDPPYIDKMFLSSGGGWRAVPDVELQRSSLLDQLIVERAKSVLADLAENARDGRQHFFMAVGFNKPHLSMICPQKYYSLYPMEDPDRFLANVSWQTPLIRPFGVFDGVETVEGQRIMPPDVLRYFRRAYFACISYIDHLIGEILNEVSRLGLAQNTIISFMADHGFHLGENREFGKITTWEFANRVPLMLRVPGTTDGGIVSSAVVESVDVFPTLAEAAGLPRIPTCPAYCLDVELCTQGISLMPLLRAPDANLKSAAVSQILHPEGRLYTLRTKQFRLVERVHNLIWSRLPDGRRKITAEWSAQRDRTELYDHFKDELEQHNVAADPRYTHVVERLRQRLHRFVQNYLF